MNIRTITLGLDWRGRNKTDLQHQIDAVGEQALARFAEADMAVRTRRVLLPPFALNKGLAGDEVVAIVRWISDVCAASGVRWFCVPFDTFGQDMRQVASVAVDVAKRFDNAFINLIVARDGEINREGILHSAGIIKSVSRLSNNGYDNFRVGASFNCAPNGPFFPFTWHEGGDGFSIGVEMVPTFVQVIEGAADRSVEAVRAALLARLTPKLAAADRIGHEIEAATGVSYRGLDASLAPFPDSDEGSVARVIELLGVDGFGSTGTLFLTSFLTTEEEKDSLDDPSNTPPL